MSKIGVVAKPQGERLKLRLIHDLKRSGVINRVTVRERVVLPRLHDAVEGILDLIHQHGGCEWELFGSDFSDAFKQIKVAQCEQKYLTGKALQGYFKYLTVLFGIKSGPLIWGRNAALLMRITAAMMHDKGVRAQCFVDDPPIALAGPEADRFKHLVFIVLLWLALGYKINWKKGS